MKFTMQRDRVVASTSGHAVAFKKGVPVYVPAEMHTEVMNLGAEPDEALPEPTAPVSKEPTDPAVRQKAIFGAFETIALRNRREDFTAGGTPHLKVLFTELGWPVDARERDQAWEAFKQANPD